jgi:hypothetical protein
MCVLYGAQKWRVHMILQTYISPVRNGISVLPLNHETKVCVCEGRIHNYIHLLSS